MWIGGFGLSQFQSEASHFSTTGQSPTGLSSCAGSGPILVGIFIGGNFITSHYAEANEFPSDFIRMAAGAVRNRGKFQPLNFGHANCSFDLNLS